MSTSTTRDYNLLYPLFLLVIVGACGALGLLVSGAICLLINVFVPMGGGLPNTVAFVAQTGGMAGILFGVAGILFTPPDTKPQPNSLWREIAWVVACSLVGSLIIIAAYSSGLIGIPATLTLANMLMAPAISMASLLAWVLVVK